VKIYSALRTTPAMAGDVTTGVVDVADLVVLVESESKEAA
jgi:hypothetical protein